ncbi:MAG: potassium transporter TrkG [Thermoplasmatota archaeon]
MNIPDILFMITSALTTTGWSTTPAQAVFLQWAPLGLLFIIVSMIIGANSSSTGGGIKAYRFGLIIKNIFWITRDMVTPDSLVKNKRYRHLQNKLADDTLLQSIMTFIYLYALILFVSFVIFTIYGYPIIDSFYEVTSAIGTVGLSSGITSLGLETLLKIILIVNMWLGRIEILPVLYFIRYVSIKTKTLI